MSARISGSNVYGHGDPSPFKVVDPPDVVIATIEKAADVDTFVALRGLWEHVETGEREFRTLWVRPRGVWAVAPWLEDPGEDDDKEAGEARRTRE